MGNDCQIKVLNKQLFQRGELGWKKMEIDNGMERKNKIFLYIMILGIVIIFIILITVVWFTSFSHKDVGHTNGIRSNLDNIGMTLPIIIVMLAYFSSFVVICCLRLKKYNYK